MRLKPANVLLICVGAIVAAAAIYGVWRWLGWYIAPETATDRKDHVQVMVVGLGAVGAVITAIIGWRNLKQSRRSTDTTIENTRLIEEEWAQSDALQKYYEQMGELLTREKLRSSAKDADVRVVARAQTLTLLQGLGPDRKHNLLRFLYESWLIDKNNPVFSLAGADLREANLRRIVLREAALDGAVLEGADLRGAKLEGINLGGAYLSGADLRNVVLTSGDLTEASLQFNRELNLRGADLRNADLSGATLTRADLQGAHLQGAHLQGADLKWSNLQEAKLQGAKLQEARINEKQLAAWGSLDGAIMPDGFMHG